MNKEHHYQTKLTWTGNNGTGTDAYRTYERSFQVEANSKSVLEGSSDPAFHGDKTKYNPEEMLVASLSSCHMLWYLHLCAEAGVVVTGYTDSAIGILFETDDGSGHFGKVVLRPVVTVLESTMMEKAEALHQKANAMCFIANSVNFPVEHQVLVKINDAQ